MQRSNFVYAICFFLVCVDKSQQKNEEVEGYFWRDYVDFIPRDAFPGGNESGKIVYVGQVLHKELLIPAKIIPSEKLAYFEWSGKEYSTNENVKILCTDNPTQLRWLSSSSTTFEKLKNKRFVRGGFEPNSQLYIGRMTKGDDTIVGKLLVNNQSIIHATYEGKAIDSKVFEVLIYQDPNDAAVVNAKGYYWRDYVGAIPSDALPAGKEGHRSTYIAQVLYNNILVPGKLVESEKKAEFEWGLQAHTSTDDVKIFCTDKPERYHWYSTNSDNFKDIKDKNFVIASREGNGVLYIARTKIKDDIVVGKLLVNEHVFLHTAYKGKSIQKTEFEVLYYEPPIDVRKR